MIVVAISDTHNQMSRIKERIPPGDLLIHAGDLTNQGSKEEMELEIDELASLPHEFKIFVPGNHDWYAQRHEKELFHYCQDRGIKLLMDNTVIINEKRIYGSPWTPNFGYWAFMLNPEQLAMLWRNIPDDTDILVTHGPPRGLLDVNFYESSTWNDDLMQYVAELKQEHCGDLALFNQVINRVQPHFHIFGHIHPSYGMKTFMNTHFLNVAICGARNVIMHEPITFEI